MVYKECLAYCITPYNLPYFKLCLVLGVIHTGLGMLAIKAFAEYSLSIKCGQVHSSGEGGGGGSIDMTWIVCICCRLRRDCGKVHRLIICPSFMTDANYGSDLKTVKDFYTRFVLRFYHHPDKK